MTSRIGITCNFFHPDPARNLFKGKRLAYTEQGMSRYLAEHGAAPLAIPHPGELSGLAPIVEQLHGILLSGGADVAPESYGHQSKRWPGDAYQDAYELEVIRLAKARGIPILGVCRGVQILNVAYGGTLYKDLLADGVTSQTHRCVEKYDQLFHAVILEPDSKLARIYGRTQGRVNSVHHQAVCRVGEGLRAVALSEDGVIEALESRSEEEFVVGVQWHPEWKRKGEDDLLCPTRIVEAFLQASRLYASLAP